MKESQYDIKWTKNAYAWLLSKLQGCDISSGSTVTGILQPIVKGFTFEAQCALYLQYKGPGYQQTEL